MIWDVSAFTYDYTIIATIVTVSLGALVVYKQWGLIKAFFGFGRPS